MVLKVNNTNYRRRVTDTGEVSIWRSSPLVKMNSSEFLFWEKLDLEILFVDYIYKKVIYPSIDVHLNWLRPSLPE